MNDSYVENDNGNDADADGGDDDTTLVKQSESVAAAAAVVGTREHLESKIADLQRYSLADILQLQSFCTFCQAKSSFPYSLVPKTTSWTELYN